MLEKEIATHSSVLVWKIPWTEEFGRLYSAWSHNQSDMTKQLTHKHMWVYITPLCEYQGACVPGHMVRACFVL